MAMYGIGEFSRITGLSVKTLRFYHAKDVLVPASIDDSSGYRYYDHSNAEKARIISHLRNMEFPLNEIKEILDNYDDQADILDYLEQHKNAIQTRMRNYKKIALSLDKIISSEREAIMTMKNSTFEVHEETLDKMLIAGVRMQGKYSDCGKGFAHIAKKFGRHIDGKPLCLYYDNECRPDDATFEACFPIRKGKEVSGVSVRQLPPIRCVSLLHKGPYDQLGRSYAKILEYVKSKAYEIILPTREVYLKGPGMILKGNPQKYLTQIQLPIKSEGI
jgi:DNA-binding transcriptional MerR regulator